MRGLIRKLDQQVILWMLLAACLVLGLSVSSSISAQRRNRVRPAPTHTRSSKATTQTRVPELSEVQLERLPPDPSVDEADIAITAHIRASSLRFDEVPNPTVEFPGQPQRTTVWEAQRENLPTPVEPGVTYRNIGIRLKITSVFSDIDRIVAEALGEIPTVDDQNSSSKSSKTSSATKKIESPISQSAPLSPAPKQRQ